MLMHQTTQVKLVKVWEAVKNQVLVFQITKVGKDVLSRAHLNYLIAVVHFCYEFVALIHVLWKLKKFSFIIFCFIWNVELKWLDHLSFNFTTFNLSIQSSFYRSVRIIDKLRYFGRSLQPEPLQQFIYAVARHENAFIPRSGLSELEEGSVPKSPVVSPVSTIFTHSHVKAGSRRKFSLIFYDS